MPAKVSAWLLVIAAAFAGSEYPLKDSTILDSGATIHVFNQISRFHNFRTVSEEHYLWAGEGRLRILGYGDVDICLKTPLNGKQLLRLTNVAYVPEFATNVASLRRLREQGIQWDTRPRTTLLRKPDGTVLGIVEDHYDQFVLEYIPEGLSRAAFFTRRNRFNSWTQRRPRKAEAYLWHLRLGHPGPGALEHLVNSTQGVRIKGITTTECDSCAKGKMHRQEHRAPRDLTDFCPGEKLALDFHDFEPDEAGYSSLLLVVDRVSGYMWDFYMRDRKTDTVITALHELLGLLERQYEIKVKAVESDNEIISKLPGVKRYLESRHIRTDPSPGDTQALNGAAERSWRTVKEQLAAIRDSSKLPNALWREISKAGVYLLNRTPRKRLEWKTPFEIFHSKGDARRKPDLTNLRAYGCKAYAMTTTAMRKEQRLKRFNPKAWIGYLVGYTSSNTFRIWNPVLNKVVIMRDVIFNEEETFSGALEELRDDIRELDLDELSTLLQEYALPEEAEEQVNPALAPRGVEEALLDSTEEIQDTIIVRTASDLQTGQAAEPIPHAGTASNSPQTGQAVTQGASRPQTGQAPGSSCDDDRNLPIPAEAVVASESTMAPTASQNTSESVGKLHTESQVEPLPTPPPSPPAALLAAVLIGSAHQMDMGLCPGGTLGNAREALSQGSVAVQHGAFHADAALGSPAAQVRSMTPADCWKGAFYAGMRATVVKTERGKGITKAAAERRVKTGEKLHRRELPEPPKRHQELEEHALGELFK
jgi:hypothetical protein